MKNLKSVIKFCFPALTLLLLSLPAMAQQTVRGTVTDSGTGETLVGATVMVQGTTTGAVTDIDGNYSINVPGPGCNTCFFFRWVQ
jgi:hypothetical protein